MTDDLADKWARVYLHALNYAYTWTPSLTCEQAEQAEDALAEYETGQTFYLLDPWASLPFVGGPLVGERMAPRRCLCAACQGLHPTWATRYRPDGWRAGAVVVGDDGSARGEYELGYLWRPDGGGS
jgi:hypothetical protein